MKVSPIFYRSHTPAFKANYSKENNVAILGSSRLTPQIIPEIVKASQITYSIILSGKNVLTGCGTKGVMGQAYYTAAELSKKDKEGKPEQNVVITKEPYWGDEDLENCVILGSASSEAARIEKFIETSDAFVVFPGGPATIQEVTTLISSNHYSKNKKQIILVGKEYFKGLDEQYQKIYQAGLLSVEPSELYTLTDDVDEVIEKANISSWL